MRSAEKKRTETCDFANEVARVSIFEYNQRCPVEINFLQTVLSTIVLQQKCLNNNATSNSLKVLGMGVGTKVLSAKNISKRCESGKEGDKFVRDCHAEVLARRSFLRFLHSYLDKNYVKIYNGEEDDIFQINGQTNLLELKENCSLHLYTSSQPCGNATIKKWAKGKEEKYFNLPNHLYPQELHNHFEEINGKKNYFQVTARKEGQVAVLVKNNNNNNQITQINENELESELENSFIQEKDNNVIPPGVSQVSKGLGCVMSCSDKIMKWNAVGLQGSLLSNLLQPLYLKTVIVGRKFGRKFLERALCCRIDKFNYVFDEITYSTHHPAMMCSSEIFDNSTILTCQVISTNENQKTFGEIENLKNDSNNEEILKEAKIDAQFSEIRCLAWWPDLNVVEIIDGKTGFISQKNCDQEEVENDIENKNLNVLSEICSYQLFQNYFKVVMSISSQFNSENNLNKTVYQFPIFNIPLHDQNDNEKNEKKIFFNLNDENNNDLTLYQIFKRNLALGGKYSNIYSLAKFKLLQERDVCDWIQKNDFFKNNLHS